MKKTFLFLLFFSCFVFVARDGVRTFLAGYVSSRYGVELVDVQFFLPNKICAKEAYCDRFRLKNVWVGIGFFGISSLAIDEATINSAGTFWDTSDTMDVVKSYMRSYFIPTTFRIKSLTYGRYTAKNVYGNHYGDMYSATFNGYYDNEETFFAKLNYNVFRSALMVDTHFVWRDKEVFFYCQGDLSWGRVFNISLATLTLGDSQYDFVGSLDFGELAAKILYKNISLQCKWKDGVSLMLDNGYFVVDSFIDLASMNAFFTIKHDEDAMIGSLKNYALDLKSKKFCGIEDLKLSAKDGVIKGSSKIKRTNLSLAGKYNISNEVLNIEINNADLKADFGSAKIFKKSYLTIDSHGIKYAMPALRFKSDDLDFDANIDYAFGKIFGGINIKHWNVIQGLSYSGRFNFNNSECREYLALNGNLKNGYSIVDVCVSKNGTEINGSFYKNNKFYVYLPLYLYPNNKFYEINREGTVIKTKLDTNIETIVKQDNVKGKINSNFVVKIGKKDVKIEGHFNLKNSLITFYKYGVVFKDLYINAIGSGNKILISKSGMFDIKKGHASIFGDIVFTPDDVRPNVKMSFDKMCLSDDGALNLIGTGWAVVSGSLINGLSIGGKVNCDGSSFKMLSYQNDYQDVEVVHVYENSVKSEKKPFPVDFRFHIDLNCPDLAINADMMKTIWSGKLQLCGENMATFEGTLKIKKGELKLFKKDFSVPVAELRFEREYPFNPILFLQAVKHIGDLMVEVKITKTIGKGEVSISSVPQKNIEDILARLLFNKDADEMSPTDWAQVGYIMQATKSGNPFQKLDQIMSKVGVTDIRINKKKRDDPSTISIGAKVDKNVEITVESDTADKSTYVKIGTNISEKVSLGASSKGDVEISYKHRYK